MTEIQHETSARNGNGRKFPTITGSPRPHYSMSQSLSQQPRLHKAAKDSGSCSVCGKTSAVKAGDGSIYQHGHRNAPCPGSNRPPATIAAAHFLHTNDDPILSDLQPASPMPPSVTTKTLRLDHPVTTCPLVKRIA